MDGRFLSMAYLQRLGFVVFDHTPKWWISLAAAYVGGVGIFATSAAWRHTYEDFAAEWSVMPALPEQWPISWVAIPVILWIFASLIHGEVKRTMVAPRLFFDAPTTENTSIIHLETKKHVDTITLFNVAIRNISVSTDGGKAVTQAFASAEFYPLYGETMECHVEYCRWTDNLKPRPDLMDKPNFTNPLNFRTIEANGASNHIDFAVVGNRWDHFFCVHWRQSRYRRLARAKVSAQW